MPHSPNKYMGEKYMYQNEKYRDKAGKYESLHNIVLMSDRLNLLPG